MAIKKTIHRATPSSRTIMASRKVAPSRSINARSINARPVSVRPATRRPVTASQSITANVRNRNAVQSASTAKFAGLSPEKRMFAHQLQTNMRKGTTAVTAATNTTNIMARPDFLEMLPMFVQKLLILDVYGSVAMRSRQQLIPYFKFIAENTKGVTKAGDILSSPFVNKQGIDPNFTGRVVKDEVMADGTEITDNLAIVYTPVLPGTVTIKYNAAGTVTDYVDDGNGNIVVAGSTTPVGYIDYSTGVVSTSGLFSPVAGNSVKATYQYDNENVGPRTPGNGGYGYEYGAQMAKGYLQLDEINLVAEAYELACYWSVYSAFAAQQEYGSNIAEMAKDAALSEITAEINSRGFAELAKAATFNPQFNWDASPVLTGAVVPSDYLNMFKLKLQQAAASIYQATRLTQPNRLVVGTNVASYISMINGFKAEAQTENVGPYKVGTLDQFEVYCDPNYNPDTWVMACKSNDIRRNSGLYGEYMPITNTDAIGLANASVQQGYATMMALKIVNPATVVSGKILGVF